MEVYTGNLLIFTFHGAYCAEFADNLIVRTLGCQAPGGIAPLSVELHGICIDFHALLELSGRSLWYIFM